MIRQVRFELLYFLEDLWWFLKHPKSKNWSEVRYRFMKVIDELITPWYYLKNGVKNIIKWFPVIWFDRQWDFCFMYNMMEKKLELMEKFFDSDKVHLVKAKSHARQMRVCKNLIVILRDGKIEDEVYGQFYEKFGNSPEWEHELIKSDEDGKPMLYQMKQWEFSTTGVPREEWYENFRIASDKARLKEVKYKKSLYRIMEKYSHYWWD